MFNQALIIFWSFAKQYKDKQTEWSHCLRKFYRFSKLSANKYECTADSLVSRASRVMNERDAKGTHRATLSSFLVTSNGKQTNYYYQPQINSRVNLYLATSRGKSEFDLLNNRVCLWNSSIQLGEKYFTLVLKVIEYSVYKLVRFFRLSNTEVDGSLKTIVTTTTTTTTWEASTRTRYFVHKLAGIYGWLLASMQHDKNSLSPKS